MTKWLTIILLAAGGVLAGGCPKDTAVPGLVMLSDPLSVEEHLQLGAIYERDGKDDQAVREYAAALRKDPASLVAITGLGNVSAHQGKYKLAVKYYKQALGIDAENAVVTNNLALAYLELGDLDEAAQTADRAVELDAADGEADPRVHETRSRVREAAGDTAGAISDLEAAMDLCAAGVDDDNMAAACAEIKSRYYRMKEKN